MEHHIRVVEMRYTEQRFDNGFLVQSRLDKRDRLTHKAAVRYDEDVVVWIYSSFEDVLESDHAMTHVFNAFCNYLHSRHRRTYWFTAEYL